MAAKSREVDQQVRDLVGLDHQQFSRVMLLPQGQFEQVLRARSGEREDLLTSLFDTGLFGEVERWLEDRAKQAVATCRRADDRLAALRAQAQDRWAEVRALTDQDGADEEPSDRPHPVEGQDHLDRLAELAAAASGQADRVAVAASAALETARAAHAAAADVARRWDRRSRLRTALDELTSAAAAVARAEVRLQDADRAAPVAPSLAALDQARDTAARAGSTSRDATDSLLAAMVAAGLPDAVLPDGAPVSTAWLDRARAHLADHRGTLAPLVQVARRRDTLRTEIAARVQQATDAERSATTAGERSVHLEQQAAATQEELESSKVAEGMLESLRATFDAADRRATAAVQLVAARDALTKDEAHHLLARSAHLDAREAHLRGREAYLEGIAAALASELVDGDPCAVCGSPDHPAPATAADGSVSRPEVEALAAAEESARIAVDASASRADAARTRVAELVGRLGGPDPAGDRGPEVDPTTARHQADAIAAELDRATAAAVRVPDLTQRLEALLAQVVVQRTAAEHAGREAAGHRSAAAAGSEELAACTAQLVQALGDQDADPATSIALLDAVDHAMGPAAQASAASDLAARSVEDAAARLTQDLERSGFPDIAAVRAAVLTPEDRDGLERSVRTHQQEMARVTTLLQAEDLADLAEDRPDTESAGAALATTQRQGAVAEAAAVSWRAASDAIAGWAGEHLEVDRSAAADRDRAAALGRLWDTVGGRAGNRVSLRRWVLAAYLEDICVLANQRLRLMSGGRYTLLVHRGGTARNRLAGLDLRVLDAHTGDERDVSTLSGGETFQASLALALAVADAVQQHSGGVRLDALFIDEGFGTLDPDALELAMDELDALRAGGRMVGVISHVGAMRERIHLGVEVTPSERGSTVRVGRIAG